MARCLPSPKDASGGAGAVHPYSGLTDMPQGRRVCHAPPASQPRSQPNSVHAVVRRCDRIDLCVLVLAPLDTLERVNARVV
jgi:hypothetical protein